MDGFATRVVDSAVVSAPGPSLRQAHIHLIQPSLDSLSIIDQGSGG